MIKETPEMTETVVGQEPVEKPAVTPVPAASDEQLVAMLVDRARSEGLQLTGEGGLLQMLTKRVLESALEGEITDHLGYEKHDAEGRNSGNSRNGTRANQECRRRWRGSGCGGTRWGAAWSSGSFLFEAGADEVGEGVGGDAAGAAEGDRGELAGADEVVDGGAAELEAVHHLGHGQQFLCRTQRGVKDRRGRRGHQLPPSAVNCRSSSLRYQTAAARRAPPGL
jgi:hypothetical protein